MLDHALEFGAVLPLAVDDDPISRSRESQRFACSFARFVLERRRRARHVVLVGRRHDRSAGCRSPFARPASESSPSRTPPAAPVRRRLPSGYSSILSRGQVALRAVQAERRPCTSPGGLASSYTSLSPSPSNGPAPSPSSLAFTCVEQHLRHDPPAGRQVALLVVDHDRVCLDRRLALPQLGVALVDRQRRRAVVHQVVGGGIGRLVCRPAARSARPCPASAGVAPPAPVAAPRVRRVSVFTASVAVIFLPSSSDVDAPGLDRRPFVHHLRRRGRFARRPRSDSAFPRPCRSARRGRWRSSFPGRTARRRRTAPSRANRSRSSSSRSSVDDKADPRRAGGRGVSRNSTLSLNVAAGQARSTPARCPEARSTGSSARASSCRRTARAAPCPWRSAPSSVVPSGARPRSMDCPDNLRRALPRGAREVDHPVPAQHRAPQRPPVGRVGEVDVPGGHGLQPAIGPGIARDASTTRAVPVSGCAARPASGRPRRLAASISCPWLTIVTPRSKRMYLSARARPAVAGLDVEAPLAVLVRLVRE